MDQPVVRGSCTETIEPQRELKIDVAKGSCGQCVGEDSLVGTRVELLTC